MFKIWKGLAIEHNASTNVYQVLICRDCGIPIRHAMMRENRRIHIPYSWLATILAPQRWSIIQYYSVPWSVTNCRLLSLSFRSYRLIKLIDYSVGWATRRSINWFLHKFYIANFWMESSVLLYLKKLIFSSLN